MQGQNDERDLETLLNLLRHQNSNFNFFTLEKIKTETEYIFSKFQKDLNKYNTNFEYSVQSIKYDIKNKEIKDIIVLMMIINKLCFGYLPRKIQIISLLLMLNKNTKNGLIEEVKTGEGKSTIIMFLATLKALEGKKVDILTSSPVLSERDSKHNKIFYEIFGLTCDYCHEDEDEDKSNESLIYRNYNADIVYGDILSLAGDYLRTNFIGTKGRGNRNFDIIIIDEIDNICIDNIMNQTQLIDNFKGYKFLEYIYLFIYYHLQQICIEQSKYYDISSIPNKKNDIVTKLLTKFNEFYDNNLIVNDIKFPPHLHDFIQNRKKDWCSCAFDALINYKINKHYVISYDEDYKFDTIKPIDFSNTGIIQDKSVWSGLHQFLEIKHGLRLTEENLNSCFISNLCFFRLYKEKYGLTGTVGSKKTEELLKDIYGLDTIFIPTFKEGKYKFNSKTDYFCDNNKEKFYENVLKEIIEKYYQNRAILVIVKFIDQVNIIRKKIIESNKININDIIIYDRNDNPEQNLFLKNEIGIRKVILSTNLCGRGTDIRITKECEKNGGLHVILTFLAESERIEKQALGRAARKGENGSGKIMLYGNASYNEIKNKRESKENTLFDYLIKSFKNRSIFFQNLFEIFCFELNKIKRQNVSKKQIMDIKERWGLFLVENDLDKLEEKEVIDEINSDSSENGKTSRKIKYEIIKNGLDKNYQIIKKRFDIFIKEIFYDKKEYQYINPFVVFMDFEEKNFELARKMCESLSIGANYLQIYKKIIGYKKKIDKTNLIDIINSFNNLKNKVEFLILQYKTYENLIKNIRYIGERMELLKQNEEKINYLIFFKQNLLDNIDFLQNIIITKKYIYTNELSIKLSEINCESENVKNYFHDFGLFNVFSMKINNTCNIF